MDPSSPVMIAPPTNILSAGAGQDLNPAQARAQVLVGKDALLSDPSSLVSRAVAAANGAGWRTLGTLGLASTGANFRESHIMFDTEVNLYYVFSTELDGNGIPDHITVVSSVPSASPTIVTTSTHGLVPGRLYATSLSGCNVAALNGSHNITVLTATTISVPVSTLGGVSATTGRYHIAGVEPKVTMRRATTPEGIVGASGAGLVRGVSQNAATPYYPTIVKRGSGASALWDLFGVCVGPPAFIGHSQFTGLTPVAQVWDTTGPTNLPLGDPSIALNPQNGFYYCVGLIDTGGPPNTYQIWRTNTLDTNDTWTLVGTVWAGQGNPDWAQTALPDPNLCFVDGRMYLMFTGGNTPGQWSTGIVEIDVTNGQAIGPVGLLLEYGIYPAWMNTVCSDLQFLRVSGQPDRIFAFGGWAPYWGIEPDTLLPNDGQAKWGCLDLA